MDFSKFDKEINLKEINKQIKEIEENGGGDYPEVPDGQYVAALENLQLGNTKDGRPMLKVQMRLVEGIGNAEQKFLSQYKKKKPCVFLNRVIFGTKNDASMIQSAVTWVNKLDLDPPVVFNGYADFADELMDIMEDLDGEEFDIKYEKDSFNSISIV